METLLTAVKPTGTPHLGNYAGAIRPALDAMGEARARAVLFVADGHALNSVTDPDALARYTYEAAAIYLACGLDPDAALFFRQSDVPEIFELAGIVACSCPKGLVNRAHAYKAAVAANRAAGRNPDAGINMGLFTYPVLMTADMLAFDATVVPVGADQRQHVEIAREIAKRMNHAYGQGTVVVPELRLRAESREVPGVDGRKMSKSYGNHIPIVAPREALRAAVFRFVTDARAPGEPADPEMVPLFSLARAIGTSQQTRSVAEALRAGVGYAQVKELVFEIVDEHLSPIRERYARLHPDAVDAALTTGAQRARDIASGVLRRVKQAVGMRPQR